MAWVLPHKYPIAPVKSTSAWSPSAISGHAFQGLMGCLAAYLEFPEVTAYRADLVKLAVDIGDRRVLAGIHYPSDNAMSWWVAFQCVKYVAKDDAQLKTMREFLRDAVQGSLLWDPMKKSVAHKALMDEVTKAVNEN
jgi:membrane-associated phospholipid phosphatase